MIFLLPLRIPISMMFMKNCNYKPQGINYTKLLQSNPKAWFIFVWHELSTLNYVVAQSVFT